MSFKVIASKRVVIVDDSRTIQALLEDSFAASKEFRVVGVAGDARSAAELIRKQQPDLVTIDLCMPYVDGAALLEMLADMPRICKVIVSDHAAHNMAIVAKLRSLGAAACVAKSDIPSGAMMIRKLSAIVAAYEASGAFDRPVPIHRLPLPNHPRQPYRGAAFGAPVPADEKRRVAYLRHKRLANATPERQFDLVTRYLARETSFPASLITFIDQETLWIKSAYGFPQSSMPRGEAFCNYTVAQDDTLIVRNAANDPVFAELPSVAGDPHIRTYVGHPIITREGIHLGALCLVDTRVRVVPDAVVARLRDMADITAELINLRTPLAA